MSGAHGSSSWIERWWWVFLVLLGVLVILLFALFHPHY
jgi:hypothetical protein